MLELFHRPAPLSGQYWGKRGVSRELLPRVQWDLVSGLLADGRNTVPDVALLP